MKERIGFIGLGIMGRPMAKNLLKSGCSLTVNARRQEVIEEFRQLGATTAATPREVAAASDLVITMLPDSPDVTEVALGKDGLIHGFRAGALFVDMSSIAASVSRQLHKHLAAIGVGALDAPCSGGEPGAVTGTLSIMVGGEDAAFEHALPVLQVLGKRINHIGGPGAGQVTKSCNQIATALITQGVIEALALAHKAGVDAAKVREALLGGFAQSKVLEMHGQRILERNFQPGFKIKLYRKDLRLALECAREFGVPLDATQIVGGEMDALIQGDQGELDFSALSLVIEKRAGLNLPQP